MQSRGKQAGRFTAVIIRVSAKPASSPAHCQQDRADMLFRANPRGQRVTNLPTPPSLDPTGRNQLFNPHSVVDGLLQIAVSRTPRPDLASCPGLLSAGALTIQR